MEPERVMAKTEEQKNVLTAGWLLALSALVGTGLMATVNWHSEPHIAYNERQDLLRSLNAVIPPHTYNNEILQDTITLQGQLLLGTKNSTTVYRARKGVTPIAAALKVVAPNGYSGPIVLLVGIDYSGKVTGLRVVKHRETPGIGDSIEIRRSNWIEIFTGKSRFNPNERGWQVKRDGGEFDQLTGATITPRAIVSAVHKSLKYFAHNRELLFSVEEEEKNTIEKIVEDSNE